MLEGRTAEGKPRARVVGVGASCWGNPGQTMASLRRGCWWGGAQQGQGISSPLPYPMEQLSSAGRELGPEPGNCWTLALRAIEVVSALFLDSEWLFCAEGSGQGRGYLALVLPAGGLGCRGSYKPL